MSQQIEKLKDLIKESSEVQVASKVTERYGLHYTIVISIGKDYIAEITLTEEAYKELMEKGEKYEVK